jgi:hypothetical protein
MSLIFNGFPSEQSARNFVAAVKDRYDCDGQVFMNAEEAHAHDPFPCVQEPPVVHIDRHESGKSEDLSLESEDLIENLVADFGGTFIGT